ncbi:contact-dependent growth inhibition system immunity protein [Klebsiella aerogenes]|nr:contact-dependent growth inhibition system immunity protein [Klebsiella aerogenes]
MINKYLDHLMGAYFNQDYDLFGETIEEVMDEYLKCEGPEYARGLIDDCHNFINKSGDPELEFVELYKFDFNPALWGITAKQFLSIISAQASRYLDNIK